MNWRWVFLSAKAPSWVIVSLSKMRKITSSECVCLTTGQPATSRPGNISHWGPFWQKTLPRLSPWIVTTEALAPYRINFSHPKEDPQPLAYLTSDANSQHGGFDISLECLIQTDKMRSAGEEAAKLSNSSFKYSYWTVAQMVTHHTVNGCAMNPGDLLGSGTQSGPEHEETGSLLELSRGGKDVITLPNGETRTFLEDGDAIVMRGYCEKDCAVRIGFGEVVGTVLPAKE
jgi:fumarylacetoacetase